MNYQLFTLKNGCFIAAIFFLFTGYACTKSNASSESATHSTQLQKAYLTNLDLCISYMDSLENAPTLARSMDYFFRARKYFKMCEPIMSYIEAESYQTLNQPNLLQVTEEDLTDIRIMEPQGFQVLEENIFGDEPQLNLIHQQAHFVTQRLGLMRQYINLEDYQDHHFLWLVRDQLLRTSLLGLTGYDSPVNQQALLEAKHSYQALIQYLGVYEYRFADHGLFQDWIQHLEASIQAFEEAGFENFDRYHFMKDHLNAQLALWNKTVKDWGVTFPFSLALNNEVSNLFTPEAFNMEHFAGYNSPSLDSNYVQLGKVLFHESALSKSKTLSCASCHHPDKAFTDGKKLSIGHDGSPVKRNAPTLSYAAYQKAFFYDKRVGNLEGQISNVFKNTQEFNFSEIEALEMILSKPEIAKLLKDQFQEPVEPKIIRESIAAYVRSLNSFDSKFDQNMQGIRNDLNEEEIWGFNLFMGKAGCGTCHFAPLFNGTLPTRFKESELEAIGVPQSAANNELDDDWGRYDVFQTAERKHFFKTPSIRNIKKTGPYMHNGVYDSLEQVMDFYNAGGALGIGIELPLQTLPADSLGLNAEEISAIIAFMESLTDEEYVNKIDRSKLLSLQ